MHYLFQTEKPSSGFADVAKYGTYKEFAFFDKVSFVNYLFKWIHGIFCVLIVYFAFFVSNDCIIEKRVL